MSGDQRRQGLLKERIDAFRPILVVYSASWEVWIPRSGSTCRSSIQKRSPLVIHASLFPVNQEANIQGLQCKEFANKYLGLLAQALIELEGAGFGTHCCCLDGIHETVVKEKAVVLPVWVYFAAVSLSHFLFTQSLDFCTHNFFCN